MGKFITLEGVTPGTDRPKVDIIDPVLPNAGALYLYEFGHPASQFGSGVPTNGQTLRNIARAQAASAVGGDASATDATLVVNAYPAGTSKLERSGKGGVHSIHSQSTATSAGISVPIPDTILNFLAANPNHSIYASFWARFTRVGDSTQGWAGASFASSPSPSELLFTISQDGSNYPTGSNRTGARRQPNSAWRPAQVSGFTPQPVYADIAVSKYTGTPQSGARKGKAMAVQTGEPYPGTTVASQVPSIILYRGYMEDLTISGRTYETVSALDYAAFQAEVLTVGGRYYNDTYTNPSTIS